MQVELRPPREDLLYPPYSADSTDSGGHHAAGLHHFAIRPRRCCRPHAAGGGSGSRSRGQTLLFLPIAGGLSEDQIEEIEEQFGHHKPIIVAYAQWLGLAPRETWISKGEFRSSAGQSIRKKITDGNTTEVVLRGAAAPFW